MVKKASLTGNIALAIIMGIGFAVALMFVLSFIMSVIIYFSPLSERIINACAIIINILSVGAGGFMAAKSNGKKGLLMGLATAICLLLIIFLFGPAQTQPVAKALSCLLPGIVGGVLGVSNSAE